MDSMTIVAPMTPAGVSAVAALRVSGPAVRNVVRALFGEKAFAKLKAREACLGTARDPRTACGANGSNGAQMIDSLLYIFFEGPNSYTGEDVLELYPHGNPLIVRELMQAIRSIEDVRLAEPGEFTRRAFLNGKMDLVQAESVADVIHSASRSELRNAHRLLGGALSKKVGALTAQIKDISARLELDVDFAEEEADPDYATWGRKIEAIRESILSILKSFKGSASVRRLPLAVLYGAPNAGKSSLANALLGEDRILVSNIPGTTRDFVEVRLFLAGGEIRLVDTAGIAEKATDALDALSMEKSREILADADLKILVVDGSDSAAMLEPQLCDGATPDIIVYSKSDLCGDAGSERWSLNCEKDGDNSASREGILDERRKTKDDRFSSAGMLDAQAGSRLGGRDDVDVCMLTEADAKSRVGVRDVAADATIDAQTTSLAHSQPQSQLSPQTCVLTTNHQPLDSHSQPQSQQSLQPISLSAKTGAGVDTLAQMMNSRLFVDRAESEDFWITSEREKACLEEALAGVDRALDLIRTNPAVELLAFEIQLVRRSLQSIVGEISSEDVLQSIFAGFCIGK